MNNDKPRKLTMQERINGGKKAYQMFVAEMQAQPDYEQNKQAAKDEIEAPVAKSKTTNFNNFIAKKIQNPEFASMVAEEEKKLDIWLKLQRSKNKSRKSLM